MSGQAGGGAVREPVSLLKRMSAHGAAGAIRRPAGARAFLRSRLRNLEMVTCAMVGRAPIHALRVAVLRAWGAQIDSTAILYHGFQVRANHRLKIGARANIGDGAILDARGGLTIGDDVNFSTGVHIWTAQHAWNDPDFSYESAPVVIGDHVWVSTRVTILPGVTIGDGAVVAAGAVVTGDLEPNGLYGGIPARKLSERVAVNYRLPGAKQKTWWW